MGASVALRNIIGIAENVFLVAVIPLQCHLNTGTVFAIRVEMHDFIDCGLIGVEVLNKSVQPPRIGKSFFLRRSLVVQYYADAGVKK